MIEALPLPPEANGDARWLGALAMALADEVASWTNAALLGALTDGRPPQRYSERAAAMSARPAFGAPM